jgi:hypothetical protein
MKKRNAFLALFIVSALLSMWGSTFFRSYYFVIPIERLNSYHIPCTSVEIAGKNHPVEIDLGSKMALSLRKDILETLTKDSAGISNRMDFRGSKYTTAAYSIPKVKIGSLSLQNIKAREEAELFTTSGSIVIKAEEPPCDGRIGREFFSGKNLFMDFRCRTLIACSKLKDIKKEGYLIDNLISTPFKITKDGIILEIETDLGTQKFVLDTGTTVSAIRSDGEKRDETQQEGKLPTIQTTAFIINGVDFGPRKLYLLDISREFSEIDGLLGMDFLEEHVVYLDFTQNTAHIGSSLIPGQKLTAG